MYDLFAYQRTRADAQPQPAVVYTLARETHVCPISAPTSRPRVSTASSYSDGFGREIQKKIQAEPGADRTMRASASIPAGSAAAGPSSTTRASRSGSTSRSSARRTLRVDRQQGVSPILFYDPLGARGGHPASRPHLGEGGLRSLAADDLGCQRHRAASRRDHRSAATIPTSATSSPIADRADTCPPGTRSASTAAGDPRERIAADKAAVHREHAHGGAFRCAGPAVPDGCPQPLRAEDAHVVDEQLRHPRRSGHRGQPARACATRSCRMAIRSAAS